MASNLYDGSVIRKWTSITDGFSTTASSWKYTNLVPTIKVPDSDYTVRIYHHCSWYAVSGTARPVNRIFRDSVQIAELGYHYIETPTNTELRQASYFVYEESPGTGTYEYQLGAANLAGSTTLELLGPVIIIYELVYTPTESITTSVPGI